MLIRCFSSPPLRWATWQAVTDSPCSLSTWVIWTAPWSQWSTAGRVSWARVPWSWSSSFTSWRSSLKRGSPPEIQIDLISPLPPLFFICTSKNLNAAESQTGSGGIPADHLCTIFTHEPSPNISNGAPGSNNLRVLVLFFVSPPLWKSRNAAGGKKEREKEEKVPGGLWSWWEGEGGIGAFLVLRGMLRRGLFKKSENVTFLLVTNEIERIWDVKCQEDLKMISYYKYLTLKKAVCIEIQYRIIQDFQLASYTCDLASNLRG